MEAYLLSNGDDLMVFRDFEDENKKETELMSEQVKKDLEQKIKQILEDKSEEVTVEQEEPGVKKDKISDREWYKNSLYQTLIKKWTK